LNSFNITQNLVLSSSNPPTPVGRGLQCRRLGRYDPRRNEVYPEPSAHAPCTPSERDASGYRELPKRFIDGGGVVEGFGLVGSWEDEPARVD